jgi:hypothetical protein
MELQFAVTGEISILKFAGIDEVTFVEKLAVSMK